MSDDAVLKVAVLTDMTGIHVFDTQGVSYFVRRPENRR